MQSDRTICCWQNGRENIAECIYFFPVYVGTNRIVLIHFWLPYLKDIFVLNNTFYSYLHNLILAFFLNLYYIFIKANACSKTPVSMANVGPPMPSPGAL